jgi:hypothetical protein
MPSINYRAFLKERAMVFIFKRLALSMTGPFGFIYTTLFNHLWDKVVSPAIDQLEIEGWIAYDRLRIDAGIRSIRDAKTPEERRDAFDDLI